MLERERVPEVNQTRTVQVGPPGGGIQLVELALWPTTSEIEAVRRINVSERTLKTP